MSRISFLNVQIYVCTVCSVCPARESSLERTDVRNLSQVEDLFLEFWIDNVCLWLILILCSFLLISLVGCFTTSPPFYKNALILGKFRFSPRFCSPMLLRRHELERRGGEEILTRWFIAATFVDACMLTRGWLFTPSTTYICEKKAVMERERKT